MDLVGEIALVTGVSSAIGGAVCRFLVSPLAAFITAEIIDMNRGSGFIDGGEVDQAMCNRQLGVANKSC